jgi:hypothetical protein
MFVQVIQGKVQDAELLLRQTERWATEVKPGVQGYLGSTGGVTADGRSIWLARFQSAEAAQANSSRPEQDAWWNETSKAYDGVPNFVDCTEVDELLGGGSNDAEFVQVIQGRAKNATQMRDMLAQAESDLHRERPDVLGGIVAWHDDNEFTQVVYFRSEAEARRQEQLTSGTELANRLRDMTEATPTFYDLTDPRMD